jgi:hypothetical protein
MQSYKQYIGCSLENKIFAVKHGVAGSTPAISTEF